MFDIEKLQKKIHEDTIDGTCEIHGDVKGVRISSVTDYKCEKCLQKELDDHAKTAILSGDALEMPWDED